MFHFGITSVPTPFGSGELETPGPEGPSWPTGARPCLDLEPEVGWAIVQWAGVVHPASISFEHRAWRHTPCPLASRPCTQRKPPAAARARSMARKKAHKRDATRETWPW